MQTGSVFSRFVNRGAAAAQILTYGPLRCRKLGISLAARKTGLEIGGPSSVFRRPWYLPVYDKVRSLDNLDFKRDTVWASHRDTFSFHTAKPRGRMYFGEASDLSQIPKDTYDFLLSSHCLEHIANPMKALEEWQRVVKRDGSLLVVLPHFARTFDRNRNLTPLEHMLEDYRRGTGEDDLTHFPEVYTRPAHPTQADEEHRRKLYDNHANRMIHHHVFNEVNSKQLLEAAGMEVLAAEPYPPHHIFLIARNVRRAARGMTA